jgi:hypothetical protein
MKATWTAEAIRSLGVRTTVPIAGAILAGLSETQSYELAKRDGFPVPVVKVGRRLVVPTAPILRLLGLDELHPGASDVPGPPGDADNGHHAHDSRRLRALDAKHTA